LRTTVTTGEKVSLEGTTTAGTVTATSTFIGSDGDMYGHGDGLAPRFG
jgi:hypothetical protein